MKQSKKKIGILYGMERSFPLALIQKIQFEQPHIIAEPVLIGAVMEGQLLDYDVILDRISQDIPFYRSMLKLASLGGTRIINNPFWSSADDKFFNYSLASKLGIPVPKTVLLPSKDHPPETTSQSMSNLLYPLQWESIFSYTGFPAFLKPFDGGGWKHVYKIESEQEFFEVYNQTQDIVMTLQESIDFTEYYRCYCIGMKYVHIMPYEPRNPAHLRYQAGFSPSDKMVELLTEYCITLCKALSYEMNTIEFAVRNGIPYAIDYMNPAPDADRQSVQEDNFSWVVEYTAKYLIELAELDRKVPSEYAWSSFIK